MMYLYALGGFVLLFGGGELLVRGAVAVSRRFGLSPLLIGMTVVAGCTSAPELVVSLDAALAGNSDIALGNVIGSNLFNIAGVLGLAALITPILVKPAELKRDTSVMMAAGVALTGAMMLGSLSRVIGVLFSLAIVAYVVLSYRSELKAQASASAELHLHEAEELEAPQSAWVGGAFLAGGLGALVVGSRFLIIGATGIAEAFGVPQAIIGLTLVAVGTSLPELATSVVAAVRGHSDVAVGNAVGSNIFNMLAILGLTSLVRPISVAERMMQIDIWVMMAAFVALALLLVWRGRIGRLAGVAFLGSYTAYSITLFAL